MRRALILLLLLPTALAYSFVPSSVSIEAVVNRDGWASVKERYMILFDSPEDLNHFKNMVESLGSSLYLWSRQVKGLTYHFGTAYTDLKDVTLSTRIVSDRMAYMILTYSLRLAKLQKDTPTYTEWIIVDFRFPWSGDAFIIPEGYTVTVVLPTDADVEEVQPAEADVRNNVITLEGPVTTTKLLVRYTLPKPPKPVSILQILSSLSLSMYAVIGIIVVGGVLFVFRRRIARAIESYVVKYSEFSEEE